MILNKIQALKFLEFKSKNQPMFKKQIPPQHTNTVPTKVDPQPPGRSTPKHSLFAHRTPSTPLADPKSTKTGITTQKRPAGQEVQRLTSTYKF